MAEETLKLFLRFRDEEAEGVIIVDSRSVYLQKNADNRQLQLTGILQCTDDQDKVYETLGKRGVEKFLEGYSSMFFLYGAAETGKTYTLLGDRNQLQDVIEVGGVGYKERGLIVRAMEQIFRKGKAQEKQKQFRIYCSCMQVSKAKIADLSKQNNKTRLRIEENRSGWFTAVNLHYSEIKDMSGFLEYYKQILELREFTNSHLIFQINLVQQDLIKTQEEPIQSYITFVQLGFITHNEELQQQQQILNQLNSLSLVLSKINSLHTVQQGFKDSRLTRILKQSICNSQNITIIGTIGKYNSYVQNLETLNFFKVAKQPDALITSHRILTVRKSRRSMKLKYDTVSNNDKDQTNSYGVSSANTLKRKESYLQITKQNGGYDRTQYLLSEKAQNQEMIKELESTLGELKSAKAEIEKKHKCKKDQMYGSIASLKYTMAQLRHNQQSAIRSITHKYQKFLEEQSTIPHKESENPRALATGTSKRIHNERHQLLPGKEQKRAVRSVLDERDQRLKSTKKDYERQISGLLQQQYKMQIQIDPYKSTVYKQTLKEIKQLHRLITSQQAYIRNITNERIDQYQLMKILDHHRFSIKPYSKEILQLLEGIENSKETGPNNFKGKAESYLRTQAFIVKTHKSRNSQGKITTLG